MNPEIKQKWVDALRSGKYAQTQGVLCNGNGIDGEPGSFCCLGVLADILGQEWIKDSSYNRSIPVYGFICSENELNENGDRGGLNTAELPDSILEQTGLKGPIVGKLMLMNDGQQNELHNIEPQSFDQIADYIEENL